MTHAPTPDAKGQFHAEATIGGAHVLFGNGYFSDPSMAAAIYIYVPDVDATYKRAVSLGAKAIREPVGHDVGRSGRRCERYVGQHLVDCDE